MFSCEFCKISKNTFFTEHLWEHLQAVVYVLIDTIPNLYSSIF